MKDPNNIFLVAYHIKFYEICKTCNYFVFCFVALKFVFQKASGSGRKPHFVWSIHRDRDGNLFLNPSCLFRGSCHHPNHASKLGSIVKKAYMLYGSIELANRGEVSQICFDT